MDSQIKVEQQQIISTSSTSPPVIDREKEIEKIREQIRECEEKIKKNNVSLLPGKSPVRLIEENDKIKWESPILKEPYSSFSEVLKQLTATKDFELASESLIRAKMQFQVIVLSTTQIWLYNRLLIVLREMLQKQGSVYKQPLFIHKVCNTYIGLKRPKCFVIVSFT